VLGGPGPPDRQQSLLCFGGRDAGQRPHLGVRQLASGQSQSEPWQGSQGARHAHLFPGRARIEADAPAEPGGTGTKASVPAPAHIELADQVEDARRGRVEVGRQLGDLVAEAIELGGGRRRREHIVSGSVERGDIHDRFPS
jgi:hypothetical protein